MRAVAFALAVVAPLASVLAIQWDSATTSAPGNLWYPGAQIRFRFQNRADARFDATGVMDGTNVGITFQSGGQYQTSVPAGQTTDYCDSCMNPLQSASILFTDAATGVTLPSNQPNPWTVPGISNWNFFTISISGRKVGSSGFTFSVEKDDNRWFAADFFTGTLRGAYHTTSLSAKRPVGSEHYVTVNTEPPNIQHNFPYTRYQPLFVNLTVMDGPNSGPEFQDPVAYTGDPEYSTPYFILSPFVYHAVIVNNNGQLASGSQIQLTGAGLDASSTYVCVFNNTDRGVVMTSAPVNPVTPAGGAGTLTCVYPDALAAVSLLDDDVVLTNITCVATNDQRNPGWLPISSNGGNEVNFRFKPQPPGDNGGGSGLTGGQIFGIILAVFVGVGVIGYAGFRLYRRHQQSAGGYESQHDAADSNKPKQIQYNPSSYQSNDDAGKPFQAAGDNI